MGKSKIEDINQKEEEVQSPLSQSMIITDPTCKELKAGLLYKDKETLKTVITFYAIQNNFQYRVIRSCSKKYNLQCLDDTCNWMMKASKYRNTNIFLIRKFIDTHTCSFEVRYGSQRQGTSQVVAECIKSRYTSIKTVYTPADIIRDMKKDFGINISYMKHTDQRKLL